MLTRALFVALCSIALARGASAQSYFRIEVVDDIDGSPVPGATLTTTHGVVLTTDVNGLAAFYEPGLMDGTVFFSIAKEGYTYPSFLGQTGKQFALDQVSEGQIVLEWVDAPPSTITEDSQTRMLQAGVPGVGDYFAIEVVDSDSGRAVPLIELAVDDATGVGVRSRWTDNNGLVAYYDIDRMGDDVTFTVRGDGYVYGAGDVVLRTDPGQSALVVVDRVNVARRLYRITGAGAYADSARLGVAAPTAQPLLNGRVMGQDTAFTALYKGEIFWIWGDTGRPEFPLGNFYTTAATSHLPADGGLDPSVGVDLEYFINPANGFVKSMAPPATIPGEGVCWMHGLTVLDDGGDESLFAFFMKVRPDFSIVKTGLARFDDTTELFDEVFTLPPGGLLPTGQSMHLTVDGLPYVYYHNELRVPADVPSLSNPSTYQVFTAHLPGSSDFDRNGAGKLRYAWRAGALPMSTDDIEPNGPLSADEVLFGHLKEATDSTPVIAHGNGSIAENGYRQRFTRIVMEIYGTSLLGELWYAEGDTPVGPWVYARKIVSHPSYSFYNPRYHPFFDRDGGRTIYFEGTYTAWLSGSARTPRHDYNQVMYELDLDDPPLALPVPIYDRSWQTLPGDFVTKTELRPGVATPRIAFFAPDRPTSEDAGEPVYWSDAACAPRELRVGGTPITPPLFYAVAADDPSPPAAAVPVYEQVDASGKRAYSTSDLPGFTHGPTPLFLAWENPIDVRFPTTDYLGPTIAKAGPDRCVTVASAGGVAAVQMDASTSIASGGGPATYLWSWDGGGQWTSEPKPSLHLGPGVHNVHLTLTAADGSHDTDDVIVSVTVDPTPPKPDRPWPWPCSAGVPGLEVGLGMLLAGLGAVRRARRSRR